MAGPTGSQKIPTKINFCIGTVKYTIAAIPSFHICIVIKFFTKTIQDVAANFLEHIFFKAIGVVILLYYASIVAILYRKQLLAWVRRRFATTLLVMAAVSRAEAQTADGNNGINQANGCAYPICPLSDE